MSSVSDKDYSNLPAAEKMLARLVEASEVIAFMKASVVSAGDEHLYVARDANSQHENPIGETLSREREDSFRVGDYVVYPAHGVGKIAGIKKENVAGYTLELFEIAFEEDKMTLRVPTNKAAAVGMRQLSSPHVVSQALEILKGRAKVKRAMWSRRAQEYEQKINSGDLLSIAEVVRDLHLVNAQREQSYSERQLYEAALERLTREVARIGMINEADATLEVGVALAANAA